MPPHARGSKRPARRAPYGFRPPAPAQATAARNAIPECVGKARPRIIHNIIHSIFRRALRRGFT
jgi:hypothetical protein